MTRIELRKRDAQVAARYAAGESTKAIAASLHLTEKQCWLARVRAGCPTPNRGPRPGSLSADQQIIASLLLSVGWNVARVAKCLRTRRYWVVKYVNEPSVRYSGYLPTLRFRRLEIHEIRKALRSRQASPLLLAQKFGVSEETIHRVAQGRR